MAQVTIDIQSPSIVDMEIVRDEDWNDPLPALTDGGVAVNLTGKQLDLHVRNWAEDVLLVRLSSADGGIAINNAAGGLATVFLARDGDAGVRALLPAGGWVQFLVLTEAGPVYREVWRGVLTVKPGLVADGDYEDGIGRLRFDSFANSGLIAAL